MMQTVATDAGELVTGSPGSAPSTLLFVISIIIPGMVAHTFNPNIPEVGLCEFEATQGYAVRPCLKKQKRNCYCCCCFETGFHELALAGLELPKWRRWALHSLSSSLGLWSAVITEVCLHGQLAVVLTVQGHVHINLAWISHCKAQSHSMGPSQRRKPVSCAVNREVVSFPPPSWAFKYICVGPWEIDHSTLLGPSPWDVSLFLADLC